MLHMAWPSRGCKAVHEHAFAATNLLDRTLTYCQSSTPGTRTCNPPNRLCKIVYVKNRNSETTNIGEPNTHTSDPKSVCGETNVCPDGEVAGGALINRSVLPLRSSGLLSPARVPLGRPSLSSITLSMWKLTSIDFRTNGRTVESIAAPTVGGYAWWTWAGYARTSSWATSIVSVESLVPFSSITVAPIDLYLARVG